MIGRNKTSHAAGPEACQPNGVRLNTPFAVMGVSYSPIAPGLAEIMTEGGDFLTLSRKEAWLFLRLLEILHSAQAGMGPAVLLSLLMRLLGDLSKSDKVAAFEMRQVQPSGHLVQPHAAKNT